LVFYVVDSLEDYKAEVLLNALHSVDFPDGFLPIRLRLNLFCKNTIQITIVSSLWATCKQWYTGKPIFIYLINKLSWWYEIWTQGLTTWATPLTLFALSYFSGSVFSFCSVSISLYDVRKACATRATLRWVLTNFMPELACYHDPPDFCLLSSWNSRHLPSHSAKKADI
jgi:hypothetical protein